MTLQEILFKNTLDLSAPLTRSVRCKDTSGQPRKRIVRQPSELVRDKDGLKPNEARILALLKRDKNRKFSALEVAERLCLSNSYCGITLAKLCEAGKATREKVVVRDVKAYVYQVAA